MSEARVTLARHYSLRQLMEIAKIVECAKLFDVDLYSLAVNIGTGMSRRP